MVVDDSVRDDEVLYRRVHWSQIIEGKVTSGVFRTTHEDGCSTGSAIHVTAEDMLTGYPGMGLVSVTGADVVESGAEAVRDPGDPSHVLIRGTGKKFPKALSLRAKLVVAPSQPVGDTGC